MSTRNILADESVSILELRSNPEAYFTDHAVAVIADDRVVGYILGADAYEEAMNALRQSQQLLVFEGRFRPSAERLREIVEKGKELLDSATE